MKNFLLMIVALIAVGASGQKAYKSIKANLKAAKPAEALKGIEALSRDATYKKDPRLYEMGVEANVALNDVQNEKAYLKQAYDTVQLFKTALGVYDYALRCDTAERILYGEKKSKKLKYEKRHSLLLHRYYSNLMAAGRFYFNKANYKEAIPYLSAVLAVPKTKLWGADTAVMASQEYSISAYLFMRSNFEIKNYKEVALYAADVLRDTLLRESGYECLAQASLAMGDSTDYVKYLDAGLSYYPHDSFFFTRLMDYYNGRGQFEKALAIADSLLQNDSSNVVYLEGKSLSLMNLGRFKESIACSERSLALDSSQVNTYYYIGANYCNLAGEVVLPTNINSKAYKKAAVLRRNYYLLARPYMERYRQKEPKQAKRWAPLLYRIYLNLNMGEQFEEIDNLLETLNV